MFSVDLTCTLTGLLAEQTRERNGAIPGRIAPFLIASEIKSREVLLLGVFESSTKISVRNCRLPRFQQSAGRKLRFFPRHFEHADHAEWFYYLETSNKYLSVGKIDGVFLVRLRLVKDD